MKRSVFAVLLATGLTGPGVATADESTSQTVPGARPYPTGISCGFVTSPRGFGEIDERHLIIDGAGTTKYLVTLLSYCWEIRSSLNIRLQRHGSGLELCTGDSIIAGRDQCFIRYVEPVANAKEGRAIVEARADAEEAERKARNNH